MKNTEVIKSGSGELLWAFRGTGGVHGALPCLQVATWAPGLIGPLGEGADWSTASPVAQEALAGPSPGGQVTRPALNNPPAGQQGRKTRAGYRERREHFPGLLHHAGLFTLSRDGQPALALSQDLPLAGHWNWFWTPFFKVLNYLQKCKNIISARRICVQNTVKVQALKVVVVDYRQLRNSATI